MRILGKRLLVEKVHVLVFLDCLCHIYIHLKSSLKDSEESPNMALGSPFSQKLHNCHFIFKKNVSNVKYWNGIFFVFLKITPENGIFCLLLPYNPTFPPIILFYSNIAQNTIIFPVGYLHTFVLPSWNLSYFDDNKLELILQWLAIPISVNSFLQTLNCTINCLIYFAHCERRRGTFWTYLIRCFLNIFWKYLKVSSFCCA